MRAAQLDKEAAELRDENDSLHRRLRGVDEASAPDSAAKVRHGGGGGGAQLEGSQIVTDSSHSVCLVLPMYSV